MSSSSPVKSSIAPVAAARQIIISGIAINDIIIFFAVFFFSSSWLSSRAHFIYKYSAIG